MKSDKQDLTKKTSSSKNGSSFQPQLDLGGGFGLGIQVFKIDSQSLKSQLNKKDKRLLIQNLENPAFARKYEKNVQIQKENKTNQKKQTQQKFTISNEQKNIIQQVAKKKQKVRIPIPRSKDQSRITQGQKIEKSQKSENLITRNNSIDRNKDKRKNIIPASKIVNQKQVLKEQKVEEYIVNFPPLQHEELQNFEIKQRQIQKKRNQMKKKITKLLKNEKEGQEQILLKQQLEDIDAKEIIQQIIQNENIGGYVNNYEQSNFNICEYMKGDSEQYIEEQIINLNKEQEKKQNVKQQKHKQQ